MTRGAKRIAAFILTLVAGQGMAAAQEQRPSVLLLDGLFIYVHQSYVGVSALAGELERMGYRAVVDTHLMTRTAREEPAVIVGHSMGGSTALNRAREMVEAGKPPPVVITIDAAFGSPPCPVPRCINYFSPGFPKVEGAENIDAWQAGAFMVNHAMLATNATIQRRVLGHAAALLEERAAAALAAAAAASGSSPAAPLAAPVPVPRPY